MKSTSETNNDTQPLFLIVVVGLRPTSGKRYVFSPAEEQLQCCGQYNHHMLDS